MPPPLTMGAMLQCSFGVAPSSLIVTPENAVLGGVMPMATIMDNIPMKNIMPFGVCSSLANPTVAAATAAALGVLTPMPCIPVTSSPWVPGKPTTLIAGKPAVDITCKLLCNWGGVIQPVSTPAMTIQVS